MHPVFYAKSTSHAEMITGEILVQQSLETILATGNHKEHSRTAIQLMERLSC
jgi:hypothetical protein